MPTVICYTLPGLGASNELFERVELPDWIEVRPIAWEACHSGESLPDYAQRLVDQIDAHRPHFYLGYSFGALVAVELALKTLPLLTVLVSGVAVRREIPFYLRYLRALGAYNFAPLIVRLPDALLRFGAGFSFGTRDPAALDMLVRMIRGIDPSFYECGLKALMNWQNERVPEPLLHIHGARDRLLPARYVKPDLLIPAEGHFLIYTDGPQIGRIIAQAVGRELEKNKL